MANTSVVYARIDSDLKHHAEEILSTLGITPTNAVAMLYSQIVLRNRFPLDLSAVPSKPLAAAALSVDQLSDEVLKGLDSIATGHVHSADEVDEMLNRKYGI